MKGSLHSHFNTTERNSELLLHTLLSTVVFGLVSVREGHVTQRVVKM